MSKEIEIANKIRALKTNKGFTVDSEHERQTVLREANRLKRYGVIEFDVVTKRDGDKFKVAAI